MAFGEKTGGHHRIGNPYEKELFRHHIAGINDIPTMKSTSGSHSSGKGESCTVGYSIDDKKGASTEPFVEAQLVGVDKQGEKDSGDLSNDR